MREVYGYPADVVQIAAGAILPRPIDLARSGLSRVGFFVTREQFLLITDRAVRGFDRGLDGDDAFRITLVAIRRAIALHEASPLFDQFCAGTLKGGDVIRSHS